MRAVTLTAEQYRAFRERLGAPAIPLLHAFYEVLTDDEALAPHAESTSRGRGPLGGGYADA